MASAASFHGSSRDFVCFCVILHIERLHMSHSCDTFVVGAGDTSAASLVPDIFKASEATKARPLAAKLEILLDLMFRKICHDPTDPGNTDWSTDRVMKVLKKQDKDLGN